MLDLASLWEQEAESQDRKVTQTGRRRRPYVRRKTIAAIYRLPRLLSGIVFCKHLPVICCPAPFSITNNIWCIIFFATYEVYQSHYLSTCHVKSVRKSMCLHGMTRVLLGQGQLQLSTKTHSNQYQRDLLHINIALEA